MSKLKSQSQAWTERNPLRVWRTKQKLSQKQLGGLVTLSVTAVGNLECGSNLPSVWTLDRIALIMDLEPETLNRKWQTWMKSKPTIPNQK